MTLRVSICAFAAAAAWASPPTAEQSEGSAANAFEEFIQRYHKNYSAAEKESRFQNFAASLELLRAENAKGHPYTLGITSLADLASEEFVEQYGQRELGEPAELWGDLPSLGVHVYSSAELPAEIDWSKRGAVTEVKHQGFCGACWAFATTGALEGAWQIATGQLVPLSEQQLVDCGAVFGNQGCKGGTVQRAFNYFGERGVCRESSYPYSAEDGRCHENDCEAGIPANGVRGYMQVDRKDDRSLMEAVSQQPVAVGARVEQTAFRLYSAGILTRACGAKLDHALLLVGYGKDPSGLALWVVKNSWGDGWGEDGYARLERGVLGDGQCGIKQDAVYPTVYRPQDSAASLGLAVAILGALVVLVAWWCGFHGLAARWRLGGRKRAPLLAAEQASSSAGL